jgi:hypothetical protein
MLNRCESGGRGFNSRGVELIQKSDTMHHQEPTLHHPGSRASAWMVHFEAQQRINRTGARIDP